MVYAMIPAASRTPALRSLPPPCSRLVLQYAGCDADLWSCRSTAVRHLWRRHHHHGALQPGPLPQPAAAPNANRYEQILTNQGIPSSIALFSVLWLPNPIHLCHSPLSRFPYRQPVRLSLSHLLRCTESKFIKALPDQLNAEIVSGTVSNIREAIVWLSYTYMYIRMLRNPMVYGVSYEERMQDPTLVSQCVPASERWMGCGVVMCGLNTAEWCGAANVCERKQ